MGTSSLLLAYFGPDTFLPLTSGLAGVVGALLVLGRLFRGWVARVVRRAPWPGPRTRLPRRNRVS